MAEAHHSRCSRSDLGRHTLEVRLEVHHMAQPSYRWSWVGKLKLAAAHASQSGLESLQGLGSANLMVRYQRVHYDNYL